MDNEKKDTLKRIRRPDTVPIYGKNAYDDDDIPQVDLPQESSQNAARNTEENSTRDVIPDEVPRRDGPGGEGGSQNM